MDDEPDLETLMKQKFRHKIKSHEWDFNFACNGAEALQKINLDDYDLVLTDINMPIMDGLQVFIFSIN